VKAGAPLVELRMPEPALLLCCLLPAGQHALDVLSHERSEPRGAASDHNRNNRQPAEPASLDEFASLGGVIVAGTTIHGRGACINRLATESGNDCRRENPCPAKTSQEPPKSPKFLGKRHFCPKGFFQGKGKNGVQFLTMSVPSGVSSGGIAVARGPFSFAPSKPSGCDRRWQSA
jgi:hypothetical protein